MMGCTHKMVALATSTLFVNAESFTKSIVIIGTVALTASLPDIDYKLGYKHRQFTHSLLCMFILGIPLYFIYKPIGIGILIGYGSHLIADSFTKMGIPLFYPYRKMIGLKKISTGGYEDWTVFWLCFGYLCTKVVHAI